MRLPKGTLTILSNQTGLKNNYLSDLVSTRSRPGRQRSIDLEEACKELGLDVPKELWMFGASDKIKAALSAPVNKNMCLDGRSKSPEQKPQG